MKNYTFFYRIGTLIFLSMFFSCEHSETKPAEISNILINTPPSKTSYYFGEHLDLSGLVVTLIWDNGINETVPFADFAEKGMISDPLNGEELKESPTIVRITHANSGMYTEQLVDVIDLSGISVKVPTIVVSYDVGDELNLSGLIVELLWEDGSTEDVAFPDFENKGITSLPMNGEVLEISTDKIIISHNSGLTTYQSIRVFGSVVDFEGNTYKTIQVANQEWMAENLKTRFFSNGDPIGDGTGKGDLSGEVDPEYWFAYEDDFNNAAVYGLLYTWHVVTDNRNACPSGWHVPGNNDWTALVNSLGGEGIAGGKLKEIGTMHWNSPNTGATDEIGFAALPGGTRGFAGFFGNLGYGGNWWSSDENGPVEGYNWGLSFSNGSIYYGGSDKKVGFSCRCVKD